MFRTMELHTILILGGRSIQDQVHSAGNSPTVQPSIRINSECLAAEFPQVTRLLDGLEKPMKSCLTYQRSPLPYALSQFLLPLMPIVALVETQNEHRFVYWFRGRSIDAVVQFQRCKQSSVIRAAGE